MVLLLSNPFLIENEVYHMLLKQDFAIAMIMLTVEPIGKF